jgi:hypothetical protein
MKLMAYPNLAPQIPVYDGSKLSMEKLKDLIGVSVKDLAQIIDVSESTVREGEVSAKTLKKAQPLLHILNMAWRILGNADEVRRWLNEPRIEWYGLSPLDSLTMGKHKAVSDFLERAIEGEISGT